MQSWSIFQRAKNKAADFCMDPFHKMTFLDDLVYRKVLSYTKCHPTIFLGETKPTSSRYLYPKEEEGTGAVPSIFLSLPRRRPAAPWNTSRHISNASLPCNKNNRSLQEEQWRLTLKTSWREAKERYHMLKGLILGDHQG